MLGELVNYESLERDNRVYSIYALSPTIISTGHPIKIMVTATMRYVMNEKKIGNIYGFTGGNYAGNVYDKTCLCPTISTMQGGNKQPMIVDKCKELGFIDNGTGKHQSNTVYDTDGVSPTLTTISGGNNQFKILESKYKEKQIVAMRGRNPENPSDRTPGIETEQRLEPQKEGIFNTLTTVQKDNLLMEHELFYETENGEKYRVRKLTPRECLRLMGVSDENIDKMLSVNSKSQCYKQAGNSIVVTVLMALFSQLGIEGVKKWNDMTDEEIIELINECK